MTPLEIRSLDCAGAEILGVDLNAITVGEWTQIEAAFAAFGAIFFRDQLLTAEELDRLGSRWGEVEPTAQAGAHGWQHDQSFREAPPLGSIFTARQGTGSTQRIASMYAAFDGLSSGTQRALEMLHGQHHSPTTGETTTHPVVVRHPISGRSSLYISPAFTTGLVGLDEHEGQALLNELFAHCQRDEFVSEISWSPGSVALIDHRAMWRFVDDAEPADAMSAVSIRGSALAPAVQPTAPAPTLAKRAGATLAGGIITAAMIGIADVLQPEKRQDDIEIVSDAPDTEPMNDSLDFGDLPPLD